eukprot:TRINITY_DN6924_c0_g1_i5.p1 TRINITY_DN6924_c0_g1~~TRINITY_DN6924_c0_g1_i5.p1  ORF type:complete len:155 (-),score=11.37 TRINITY_DN6924_c0_g1_i5:94-558(-)
MKTYTYCGLSGYNTPTCPLKKTFIADDIWAISHTDLNPTRSFFDLTHEGEIIVPDTPFPTPQGSITNSTIITNLSNDSEDQNKEFVSVPQSQEEMTVETTSFTDKETGTDVPSTDKVRPSKSLCIHFPPFNGNLPNNIQIQGKTLKTSVCLFTI